MSACENSLTCRTCQSVTTGGVNIFNANNKSILKKLRACADVSLYDNDVLPKMMCPECLVKLEDAYAFKIQCEFTETKLLNELQTICTTDDTDQLKPVANIILNIEKTPALVELHGVVFEDYSILDGLNNPLKLKDNSPKNLTEGANAQKVEDYLSKSGFVYENLEIEDGKVDNCELEADIVKECPSTLTKEQETDIIDDERNESEELGHLANQKVFACDACEQEFTNFDEFNQHKKNHGKERYQCDICLKWFCKRYHLKNHRFIHSNVNNVKCKHCDKTYSNQGNLDRHIRVTHYDEKNYKCTMCDKSFSQSSILRQHNAMHLGCMYECDICHKSFKSRDYLKLHKDRHLPPDQQKFVPRPRPTKTKQATTPSPRPKEAKHVCPQCGKRSSTQYMHQAHMRTHTGEKPYQCGVCSRKFAFHQSLRSHLLVHTGEKPFKCKDCGLAFRQHGHLKGHSLVHSGEKKHACKVCGKTFALRGNLTVHLRTHTGETPHHCQLCPKKFYDSNGLKRHVRTHAKAAGRSGNFNGNLLGEKTAMGGEEDMVLLDGNNMGFYTVAEVNADRGGIADVSFGL